MSPLKEKEEPYHQGSGSSSSGTTSDIVDRAGFFWVCSSGQFIDAWQEAAPYPTRVNAGFSTQGRDQRAVGTLGTT